MQINIEIDDKLVIDCIAGAKIGYWGVAYTFSREAMSLHVDDVEDKPAKSYFIDRAKMRYGLEVMARLSPHNFCNLLRRGYDSVTGDILIQCCIFGEIKYG